MKVRALVASFLGIAALQGAFGQIVSNVNHYSFLQVGTTSFDYKYTRGGSPRTGFYWYWRLTTHQSTQLTANTALNASSGLVTSNGTYFGPTYYGSGLSSNTFSNGVTLATYTASLQANTDLLTTLTAHQGATANAVNEDEFSFTLPSDSFITLTAKGTQYATVTLSSVADGTIYTAVGNGSFADNVVAGDYTVIGRTNQSALRNLFTGQSISPGLTKTSLTYSIKVSPAN